MKTRHDAWTLENDELLAETVLTYIQSGRTQTSAFEDVGNLLNRTPGACGYRWNAEIRKRYTKEFEQAKKNRKVNIRNKKKDTKQEKVMAAQHINSNKSGKNIEDIEFNQLTIDDCLDFLSRIQIQEDHVHILEENKRLLEENRVLHKVQEDITKKYDQLHQQKQNIDHDYKILIRLISQAQQMSEHSLEEKLNYH